MNPGMKKRKKPAKNNEEERSEQTARAETAEAEEPVVEALEPEAEPSAAEDRERQEAAGAEDLSGKVAALEDQLLRLRAEYANYKRRSEKEKAELSTLIKANVYSGILSVIDDFERFFQHVHCCRESVAEEFVKGVEMIHNSLVGTLNKQGVEAIEATEVPFDPHCHEAMLIEPVEKQSDDHMVRQVLEVGYRLGELIIRPAKVKVGVYSENQDSGQNSES